MQKICLYAFIVVKLLISCSIFVPNYVLLSGTTKFVVQVSNAVGYHLLI